MGGKVLREIVSCLATLGWLALSGCTSSPHGAGPADAGVVLPDSPAGTQLAWLVGLLNGPPSAITVTAVTPHFSADLLQQLPAPDLTAALAGIAASDAPVTVQEIESSSPSSIVAIVETGRHLFFRTRLVTVPQGSASGVGQISGLLLESAPELDSSLRDPAVLDARLASVATESRLFIGRVEGEGCTAVHALRADEPMPLASMFKIYVLGALAADIASGRTQWTDPVTIQDQLKSLPSGVLQDQADGSMISVQEMATDMISISDNTAADHLIQLIGRERVEAYQAEMGHSAPALNMPFLTTRELFLLKLSASPAERAAYLAAAPDARRGVLEGDYDHRPLPALVAALAWTTPIDVDRLEWFAAPTDICRAFAALQAASARPTGTSISAILAVNPGLPIDTRTFSYVGYKGGSEPGVLTLGWLLRRASDGAWVVVTLGFADRTTPIDETLALYYGLAAVAEAGR